MTEAQLFARDIAGARALLGLAEIMADILSPAPTASIEIEDIYRAYAREAGRRGSAPLPATIAAPLIRQFCDDAPEIVVFQVEDKLFIRGVRLIEEGERCAEEPQETPSQAPSPARSWLRRWASRNA